MVRHRFLIGSPSFRAEEFEAAGSIGADNHANTERGGGGCRLIESRTDGF